MQPSSYITNKLIAKKIIAEDEYELYQYSINALFEMTGYFIVTIILGILLNRIGFTLLFLALVIPGRSIFGGCHARTAGKCFCLSILVYLCCVIFPNYFTSISNLFVCISVICIGILIGVLAPVDCIEKPMKEKRKRKFSFYSKIFVLLIWGIFTVLWQYSFRIYCLEILLILCYFNLTLLIEIVRKFCRKTI